MSTLTALSLLALAYTVLRWFVDRRALHLATEELKSQRGGPSQTIDVSEADGFLVVGTLPCGLEVSFEFKNYVVTIDNLVHKTVARGPRGEPSWQDRYLEAGDAIMIRIGTKLDSPGALLALVQDPTSAGKLLSLRDIEVQVLRSNTP